MKRPKKKSAPEKSAQDKPWWPYLLLAAAVVGVYWRSLSGGFVLDDRTLFRDSSSLSDLGSIGRGFTQDVGAVRKGSETVISSYYRPLFLALTTAYYQVVGGRPRPWHQASVALAVLVAWLAYGWLRHFGWSARLGFWIALVFSLHPAHTSSVAWASGIQELLAATFCLGALAALRWRSESASKAPLVLSTLLFAAALLSKEVSAALLPFTAVWFWWERRNGAEGPLQIRLRQAVAWFGALLAVYLVVRIAVLGGLTQPVPGAPSAFSAALASPLAALTYVRLLVWPIEFSIFRPERPDLTLASPAFWVTGLLQIGLIALAAWAIRRRPALLLPSTWFLVWLLPVLNLWALPAQWMVSDRYLFLPALALPWILAIVLPRRAAVATLAVLALAFAALTVRYSAIFASESAFVAAMVRAEPTSSIVFATQGGLRLSSGDRVGARLAFARAVELDPLAAAALLSLGDLEREAGDYGAAEGHYRQALPVRPYASKPFKLLTIDLARAGYVHRARILIEEAGDRWPEDFEVRLLETALVARDGRRTAAEAAYSAAVRLRPDDPAVAGGLDATLGRLAPTLAFTP